jgi:hypothetical protein
VYFHYCLAKRVINNGEMIYITRADMTQVIPIDHNRNHRLTEDKQQLTSSTYSDSNISFLYNNKEHSNNNNLGGTIEKLDLAYGLIELLVKNNYTLDSLINTTPSDLSRVLAIDQEVGAIICAAVNKKNNRGRKASNHAIAGDDVNAGS